MLFWEALGTREYVILAAVGLALIWGWCTIIRDNKKASEASISWNSAEIDPEQKITSFDEHEADHHRDGEHHDG